MEEITATVEEISSGMENIANNTGDQFTALKNLLIKMEELTALNKSVEAVAGDSTEQTMKINDYAETGKKSLTRMNDTIKKIETSSKEMKNIISMISDISDRINLLSLNAAIESARAGDAGRGFAVVADEISKLADQTASSISEIDTLIRVNGQEINTGINNVTESINKIEVIIDGVSVIDETMKKIMGLMNSQTEMNDLVLLETRKLEKLSDEIKNSTGEQKIATHEIVKSLSVINELIQTNAMGAEKTASLSGKVAGIAEELNVRVDFFRI